MTAVALVRRQWAASIYLGWSILALVLSFAFANFFGWAEHPTPDMWAGKLFAPLMLTACYGLLAGTILLTASRSVGGAIGWTIPAFLLGSLTTLIGRALLRLGHLGCGDNCTPGVTPYWVADLTGWWLALATLVPAALVVTQRLLERQQRLATEAAGGATTDAPA